MPMTTTPDITECRCCKHCGWDPDGLYCGHPKSFAETMFGRGLIVARAEGSFCGPGASLFEEKPEVGAP